MNKPTFNFELQTELSHLVERFSVCSVVETLGVVCELRAVHARENDGTAHKLRTVGMALIELSVKCFAL